jgi:chromosome segregation ATPase
MTTGEVLTVIAILAAGGLVTWALWMILAEIRASREFGGRQLEALQRLAEAVTESSKRMAYSGEIQSGAVQGLEVKVSASLASLQTVLVEGREASRAGLSTVAASINTVSADLGELRKAVVAVKDAIQHTQATLEGQAKSDEKTQGRLKEIGDALGKVALNTDETGRLLHRAADSLLTKVAEQIGASGEAIEKVAAPIVKALERNTESVEGLRKSLAEGLAALPTGVVAQLSKNGDALEKLRRTISDDVAGLSKE